MTLADQIPTWPDIDMRIMRRAFDSNVATLFGMTKNDAGDIATETVVGSRETAWLPDHVILAGHDDPYRDLPGRLRVLLARKLGVPEPKAGARPDRYGASAGPSGPSVGMRKEHGG